jgi:hypothetical protein
LKAADEGGRWTSPSSPEQGSSQMNELLPVIHSTHLGDERAGAAYAESGMGEGPVWEPTDLEVPDLVAELRHAQRMKAAWQWVERQLKAELGDHLGIGGAYRLDDVWYRYKHGYTEKCVDRQGFWDWVRADADPESLFNPDYAWKSGMPKAVRDTFFEKIDRPPDIETMQITGNPRVPGYLADLPTGTLIEGKHDDVE